jgi:hypothetical protein
MKVVCGLSWRFLYYRSDGLDQYLRIICRRYEANQASAANRSDANKNVANNIVACYTRVTMKRGAGSWVSGERFWNRQKEMALFLEYLRDEASIQLTGQRRIGKTSLVREAARRLEGEFVCVYVDVQSCGDGRDAVAELAAATQPLRSVWNRVTGWAASFGGKVSEVSVHEIKIALRAAVAEADWRTRGEQLFDLITAGEQPVVVIIDELPILVNRLLKGDDYTITPVRLRQTDELLSWLRHISLKYRGKLRLVVTGSIGLEPVVHQAGLSATLNHLHAFDLGPWTRETAEACIESLASEYDVPMAAGVTRAMVDEIGICIPHHVQVFFDNIYEVFKIKGLTQITVDDVTEVYKHKMLGARGHAELSHLEERLKLVLGVQLQGLAIDLLTEAAMVTGGLSPLSARFLAQDRLEPAGDPILRGILEILEHDGYLGRRGESYVFVSKLQKDWWVSRFSFSYQPLSERRAR